LKELRQLFLKSKFLVEENYHTILMTHETRDRLFMSQFCIAKANRGENQTIYGDLRKVILLGAN
jgi:hypothetical protein